MMLVLGLVSTVSASDKAQFEKLANNAIKSVVSGSVNADALMKDMETLVSLGKKFCKANAKGKGTKYMNLVLSHADNMKKLSLEQIEEEWHDGGMAKANGINLEQFGHFDAVSSAADAVIHPATCYIVLKNYKANGDKDGLDQIKDELSEVLEHLKHL